jgi:hypothetical protein
MKQRMWKYAFGGFQVSLTLRTWFGGALWQILSKTLPQEAQAIDPISKLAGFEQIKHGPTTT